MTMRTRSRYLWTGTLIASLALPAAAGEKEKMHEEMLVLARRMHDARAQPANAMEIEDLQKQYTELSLRLGGDDPARGLGFGGPVPRTGHAPSTISAPPCGGAQATSATYTNSVPTPLADSPGGGQSATTTSTILVAGAGTIVWDVDLTTFIRHTFGADLDITLTSPAGTVVTITTDNGNAFDNVFNGTLWDDSAQTPATDRVYANFVVATPLVPEEAMGAFIGEDPNGLWTLAVADDAISNTGTLDQWSLDITTLDFAPATVVASFSYTSPLAIPDNNPSGLATLVGVSGLPTSITNVDLTTYITHTFPADLTFFLTSPQGTVVTISTNNGGNRDNVFNGTLWDDAGGSPATDYNYAPNVVATPLVPEAALSAFIGEDPNGFWTLTVSDILIGETGALQGWQLDIATCAILATGTSFCAGDGLDPNVTTPCPCANFGASGNGCANSVHATGANLSASGNTNPDTVVLSASGMPGPVTAIYLKGNLSNGVGVLFGDGVRCVDGALIRLGTEVNVGGASAYPSGAQASVSVRGQTPPGSGLVGYYQTYYRNSSVGFCPPETFNVSNGYTITW